MSEPRSTSSNSKPDPSKADVIAWLEAFASAVRAGDFATGATLFAPDVVAFGTVGVMMHGLDELMAGQWKHIWTSTTGFHFDLDKAVIEVHGDVAWAAAPWASVGYRADGTRFDRVGRATFVLQSRGGRWVALHSHHSMNPRP
jgi:ketosteroid isomerase-like protein